MAAQSATKIYHNKTYPSIDPTRPELSAKGKTIVITGAGTGIGAEAALYFAKASASVVAILGRRELPLLETKDRIEKEYPNTKIVAIPTDVTKPDEVEAAFAQIAGNGNIDVLISNAAVIGVQGKVAEVTSDEIVAGITTNVSGNINVAKAFLKYGTKDGVIIETNSAAAHANVAPGFTSYNVAKAATARFYSSLGFEHPDLTIFSIQPGAVVTAMSAEAGYKPKKEGEDWAWDGGDGNAALSKQDLANLPASFMVWLASPEAKFLNGKYLWANWDVDELKERAAEITSSPFLSIGLVGWPFA